MKYRLVVATAATLTLSSLMAVSNAQADEVKQPTLTDAYVTGSTFVDPHGAVLTKSDGLKTVSGTVTLDSAGQQKSPGIFGSTKTVADIRLGSSYVKSVEKYQYFYDGQSYASGKKDYRDVTGSRRVVEVCFKYMRDNKNLIDWQCSRASAGPLWSPGAVVKKGVRDTLNPWARKTTFHYSYKVV